MKSKEEIRKHLEKVRNLKVNVKDEENKEIDKIIKEVEEEKK